MKNTISTEPYIESDQNPLLTRGLIGPLRPHINPPSAAVSRVQNPNRNSPKSRVHRRHCRRRTLHLSGESSTRASSPHPLCASPSPYASNGLAPAFSCAPGRLILRRPTPPSAAHLRRARRGGEGPSRPRLPRHQVRHDNPRPVVRVSLSP